MSNRNIGRTSLAAVTLAATGLVGLGSAPLAFAQTDENPIAHQLSVCSADTGVAIALDLSGSDLDMQKATVAGFINSVESDMDLTLIVANGDEVTTQTFALVKDRDAALDFVSNLTPASASTPDWDAVLGAAHSIQGAQVLIALSDSFETGFNTAASVLRGNGLAVTPIALGKVSTPSNPTTKADTPKQDTGTKESTPNTDKPETAPTTGNQAPKDTTTKNPAPKDTAAPTTGNNAPKDTTTKNPAPKDTTAPTTGNNAPKDTTTKNPAPKDTTTNNPAPKGTTTNNPTTSAPSTGGSSAGGLLGLLGGSGALKGILDIGKNLINNAGGIGGIIDQGKKLLDGFGGINGIINMGKSLLGGFLPLAALSESTDPNAILAYASAEQLVDANGNWDAARINELAQEKGILDTNGNLDVQAAANLAGAPELANSDNTLNTDAAVSLLAATDLTPLLGVNESGADVLKLENASAVTADVDVADVDRLLSGTNLQAAAANEEVETLAVSLAAAEENGTLNDDVAVMAENSANENSADKSNDAADEVDGVLRAASAEEAVSLISDTVADNCEKAPAEAPKTDNAPKSEQGRGQLASTGASVLGVLGLGGLAAAGGAAMMAGRKKD